MKLSFRILFSIILTTWCLEAFAQQPPVLFTLKGKIVDESSGSPLEFSTVALKKLRDSSLVSGSIAGSTGEFKIADIPPGGYFLEIAFMGYERYTNKVILKPQGSSPVNDLGSIKLKLSAQMLEEAEIVADKSFVMNNIDKKTYNTEQLTVATGGNANDVLQNLPSVEVDVDGNVSLRGNENVSILIDGRPSGLTGTGGKSLLETLPASAIEKVEVITNPSAKYDPDGISGIINIITKKNKLSGLTGNVGITSNIDKGYGANGSLNYRQGKFNIYSNFGFNHNIRHSSSESHRETYFDDGTSVLDQSGEGESNNNSYNIKVGADYNLTDKSTLSFSTMFNQGMSDFDQYLWYHYPGNSINSDSLYRRDTDGSSDFHGIDMDLSYRKYFKTPGRILNIQATSSMNTDDDIDHYNQQTYFSQSTPDYSVPAELQNDDANETNEVYTISADYEHPIGEDKKMEGGVKSTLRYIDNDFHSENFDYATGEFVNNLDVSNQFVYNDGVHALYAQYKQSLGKFGFQAGLRSEYAQRQSELINTGENFTKDYFSFFPSAFLSWKPNNNWQLKASYSRRINRPRTGQLNPFASYDDPLNISTGNPDLDPDYTDSYELEGNRVFDKVTITTTLYYRYTHNPIQRYRQYDASTGIGTVTYQNINSGENIGFEFILNASIFKWWALTFTSNIYQNTIDATNLESDLGSSDIVLSSRIFTTIKLPWKFEFQLNYSYRAPRSEERRVGKE